MTTESTLRTTLASRFDDYTVHRRVRAGERNTVFAVTVDGRRRLALSRLDRTTR